MNDSWGSPLDITDALQAHFGAFNIDLAAEPWSAVCEAFITEQMDLVKQRMFIGHGFCNPPYSRGNLERFVSYIRERVVEAQWQQVTMLVPYYPAEGWWRHVARPEGKVIGADYCYGHIAHKKLKEWTRYHYAGLTVDVISVAGRINYRYPPRWAGAKESARFSSAVVRFVHPEASGV